MFLGQILCSAESSIQLAIGLVDHSIEVFECSMREY